MTAHQLFQSFRLKSLELKNRIVMAPMTRSFSPGGVPTPKVADYYARRAEGEVGLVVSEGTVVNRPASSNDPNIPHFYGEEPLAGWKAVIDKVHAVGGIMAPQLWHMGVVARVVNTRFYVEAIETGAFDFLAPPFNAIDLAYVVRSAMNTVATRRSTGLASSQAPARSFRAKVREVDAQAS